MSGASLVFVVLGALLVLERVVKQILVARFFRRPPPPPGPDPELVSILQPVVSGDPALAAVSGAYFPSHSRWQQAPSSDASYDLVLARELWEESVRMTGLTAAESPLALVPAA